MSSRHASLLTLLAKKGNRSQTSHTTDNSGGESRFDYAGISGLRTLCAPEIDDDRILIRTEQTESLSRCPKCGGELKRNGTRRQLLRDEPRGLRSVVIEVRRQNYRCKACQAAMLQPLCGIDENRRMTSRLLQYTEANALLDKFNMVSLRTGLSTRSVQDILHHHVLSLDKVFRFKTPRVLGLDGIHIERKRDENNNLCRERRQRSVFTDIEAGQVIEVRENSTRDELIAGIKRIPNYKQIEIVVIDMSLVLRSAVQEILPQAVIVIDRFHIQRYANDSMDNVRRRLRLNIDEKRGESTMCDKDLLRKHWYDLSSEEQEYLQLWFKLQPELGVAYHTKEAFFGIWDALSSDIARERYRRWLEQLPSEFWRDFEPLLSPMKNWGEYIFNYFDHRYTNAFTEQANRQIRDILRASRNCSFETYRAKIIYGTQLRKQMEEAREKRAKAKKCGKNGTLTGRKSRKKTKARVGKKSRVILKPAALQMSLLGNEGR
jgi:transposase